MKRIILICASIFAVVGDFAQENETILKKLKEKYGDVRYFENSGGWYRIRKDGVFGACDLNGNEIVKPVYNDACYLGKYYLVKKHGKEGACNLNGKEVVPPVYDTVLFYEKYYIAKNENAEDEIVYDLYGNKTKYQFLFRDIDENLIIFKESGKWGVMDSCYSVLIPAEYDDRIYFDKDGVAQVCKNGVISLLQHPIKGTSLALANGNVHNDIDSKIPQTHKKNNETFAFIIANENYANFTSADYAINDGKVFAEYCKKTLGLPEHNVRYYEDATYGNLVSTIKKVEDIASVYEGDATIIFYYSGLGTIDEQDKERYILPTDASINTLVNTGYRVQKLIEQLNKLKTEKTLVLLDAPFTGADKKGKSLVKNRGIRISPKQNTTSNNTLVCFSNSNNENSYASAKYGHGLFTYYILKKLQETNGGCSWGELLENTIEQVKKESLAEFDNVQTPLFVMPNPNNNILNNKF